MVAFVFAATTVWLVARFAPFSIAARALFAFGYFPFYEYGIIARNYSLGMLLLVGTGILWPFRKQRPVLFAILLVLLAHANALALALAGLIFMAHLWRGIRSKSDFQRNRTSIFVTVAGLLASAYLVTPAADFSLGFEGLKATDASFGFYVSRVLEIVPQVFFPIPDNRLSFWETHWFASQFVFSETYLQFESVVSLAILGLAALSLSDSKKVLLFWIGGTSMLFIIFGVIHHGNVRHHGFIFLLYFMSYWMTCLEATASGKINLSPTKKVGRAFFWVVLLAQAYAGWKAAGQEWRETFSTARATAAAMEEEGLQDLPMLGAPDDIIVALVGYLDNKSIYYVNDERWGSFVRWTKSRKARNDRFSQAPNQRIIKSITAVCTEHPQSDRVLVAVDELFPESVLVANPGLELVVDHHNYDAVVWDERLSVYSARCASFQ